MTPHIVITIYPKLVSVRRYRSGLPVHKFKLAITDSEQFQDVMKRVETEVKLLQKDKT